jgi:hypothetical protein
LLLVQVELRANGFGIAAVKAVLRELLLFSEANVAIGPVSRPAQIIDALGALQKGADAFEPIGKFDGNGVEVQAAALLEVSELGDLETVEQNLPADTPGAERRRFPVVFLEANVMLAQVDADRGQALQVQVLNVRRGRLEDDLKLRVLVETVGILAIAPVGGPTARLNVGRRGMSSVRERERKVSGCIVPAPTSIS